MKLYFFIEARIDKYNGTYYLPDMFGEKVLSRYLEVFDNISVVCRVREVTNLNQAGVSPLNNPSITIIELPIYNGLFDYIKKKRLIKKIISQHINPKSAYICRVPGQIGLIATDILIEKGIKYGVEVVGDPWDSLAPQACKHPLAPVLRVIARFELQKIVRNSTAALYVTEYVLQNRYQTRSGVYTTNASNVELSKDNIQTIEPTLNQFSKKDAYSFMSIGSLAQMYKAPDIVLKALSKVSEAGIKFHFTWFGDGKYRKSMIELAKQLGLEDLVSFPGNVSHDDIMRALKDCNILIHASIAEGLPRAVIEAMANAIPVIGTNVGGIPELLMSEAIIRPKDDQALFDKVKMFTDNPDKMLQHAVHNLKKANEFEKSLLAKRRFEFYKIVEGLNSDI